MASQHPPSDNRNMICGHCQRIFKADVKFSRPHTMLKDSYKIKTYSQNERANFVHYNLFRGFETSVSNGCHLCLLFYDQFPFDVREVLRESVKGGLIEVSTAVNETVSEYDIQLWYPYPAHVRDSRGSPGFIATLHMNSKASEGPSWTPLPSETNNLQSHLSGLQRHLLRPGLVPAGQEHAHGSMTATSSMICATYRGSNHTPYHHD